MPSKLLLVNTILAVLIAALIPFTPLGEIFGFGKISWLVMLSIAVLVFAYLLLAQIVKVYFYRKIKL
jgi:Mg2+-importing ATPase